LFYGLLRRSTYRSFRRTEWYQLAKLSGFTVSRLHPLKNAEYLKVSWRRLRLAYNDPNTPAEIKKITNGKLHLAYDTISENGTTQLVIDAFGSDDESRKARRRNSSISSISPAMLDAKADTVTRHSLLAYTMLGKEFTAYRVHLPAMPHITRFLFTRMEFSTIAQGE